MIIQFHKNLQLSDWYIITDLIYTESKEVIWYRAQIIDVGEGRETDTTRVMVRKGYESGRYYVNFYSKLYHLNKYYSEPIEYYGAEDYKAHIDSFLIKMSKLNIFE